MDKLVRITEQYETVVVPKLASYLTIEIPTDKIAKLTDFVTRLVEYKLATDKKYQIDSGELTKRCYNGFLGELAIETLTGIDFMDWTIGHANAYHIGDLASMGYNVGVKSSELGNFPVVPNNPTRPELICVIMSDTTVKVAGLAVKSVLFDYQSDALIKSGTLSAKGTKTGFYGFEALIPIRNLEELMMSIEPYPAFIIAPPPPGYIEAIPFQIAEPEPDFVYKQ